MTPRLGFRLSALLGSLVLVGVLAAPTLASGNGQQALTIHDINAEEHPDVTLTVEPPPALFDEELPEDAFTVTENGAERTVEVTARPATDLEVVLTLDTSGSVAGKPMTALRKAAVEFVEQMPADTRIGVVRFDSQPEVVQAPTADHEAVVDGIRELEPRSDTALYDAVVGTLDLFQEPGATQAAVLFADGQDSVSASTITEAVAAVEGAGVPLHVIELATDAQRPEALQQLADASDGQLIATDETEELSTLYDQVAGQLVRQYALTYISDAAGETEVTVTVDHDGVRADSRRTVVFPEAATPPGGALVTPGLWAGRVWLLIGAGLVFCALATGFLTVFAPRRRAAQLTGTYRRQAHDGRTALAGLGDRLVGAADSSLQRHGKRTALNQSLERAGVSLRAGEFVVLTACGAFAAWVVGTVLVAWWFGVVLAGSSVLATRMVINFLAGRRQRLFLDQLGDTLQMLSGGLRAGYGLQQAFDAVAKEASSPTAEELNRVLVEVRLGRDLMDALGAMAERLASEDFTWVVQAIAIHREIGGDLAEVLDTVAGTVRERGRIRRQVKALSAEGRLSAVVLFGLPFFVGGFILLTNPGYLSVLTTSLPGLAMLATGAVMLTVGGLWLRRIVDLQY